MSPQERTHRVASRAVDRRTTWCYRLREQSSGKESVFPHAGQLGHKPALSANRPASDKLHRCLPRRLAEEGSYIRPVRRRARPKSMQSALPWVVAGEDSSPGKRGDQHIRLMWLVAHKGRRRRRFAVDESRVIRHHSPHHRMRSQGSPRALTQQSIWPPGCRRDGDDMARLDDGDRCDRGARGVDVRCRGGQALPNR